MEQKFHSLRSEQFESILTNQKCIPEEINQKQDLRSRTVEN